MNTNIIAAILIILVITGYLVTGGYYRKQAGNLKGILKFIISYRAISYIIGGILLIFVIVYYFLTTIFIK